LSQSLASRKSLLNAVVSAGALALVAAAPGGAKAQAYNYGYTGALQNLLVPTTGLYFMEAAGAQGGGGYAGGGGYGATIGGAWNLTAGETVTILVGGAGSRGATSPVAGAAARRSSCLAATLW
jgi:hypothetical protein